MKFRQSLNSLAANRVLHLSIAIIILIIIALWVINALHIAYPISVTTTQSSGELAVVGEGKVDVVPDTAMVNLGIIVSNADTVEAAQERINEVNNAIVASLKELGVEDKDISTSNYSINPDYNFESGTNEITGYSGNASVSIKVRNIDLLAQVIERSTAAGANQVLGTNFVIDNPEDFRKKARDEAIANAKSQAKELADSLGIELGEVTNIVEANVSNPPSPLFDARSMSLEGAGGSANLQPGSQTITSTVTLYFEKR